MRIFPEFDSTFFKDGYARESESEIQALLAAPPGLKDFPQLAVVFFPPDNLDISSLFRLEVIV